MTSAGATRRLEAAADGLRRFEPGRDLPAVIELMRLGFEGELEERDRQWLDDLSRLSALAGPLLTWIVRLVPPIGSSLGGFVWVEGGRVVANASLMRGIEGVWVIANVVTLPECRRRGIATRLVQASIGAARSAGAREIQLQVRDDNRAAQALYEGMGFRTVFSTTHLWRAAGRLPETRRRAHERPFRPRQSAPSSDAGDPGARSAPASLEQGPPEGDGVFVIPLGRKHRRTAERLVHRANAGAATVASPVRAFLESTGPLAALGDRLLGRRRVVLGARCRSELRAIAAASRSANGEVHEAGIVTDPAWRGRVEAPLVAALVSRLEAPGVQDVHIEVDARETAAIDALVGRGFQVRKTLDRLALHLR